MTATSPLLATEFSAQLPWDPIPEVERRYRRLLGVFLFLILLISVAVRVVVLPAPERSAKPAIPDRLVKMVLEQKAKPVPPPPAPVVQESKSETETEPTPAVVDSPPKPLPETEPAPTSLNPTPDNSVAAEGEGQRKARARDKARQQIAVFDALADLRVQAEPAPNTRAEVIAAPTQLQTGDSALTQRALIADHSKAGSGGVSIGRVSTDQGSGGGLSGTGTSRVVSGIGGLGNSGSGLGGTGTGTGGVAGNAPASSQPVKANASINKAKRSDESISLGFDGVHGALQALYQRALRSNPEMKGKITFRLEIQADGKVSQCEIVASELGDAELERKLSARVRQIDFGAKDVAVWRDVYFVDFFPS